MKKIVGLKNVLSMAAVLFIFLGTSGIANGYGGGEGDGGGGEGSGDGSGGPQQIKKLSEEEIEKIFLGMNAKDKKALVEAFAGSDVTKETLIAIRNAIRESMEGRQEVREGEMASAHTEASIMNGLTLIVEGADKAGQVSQFVLHFVPGVGWVTSGALDAARGGADAYRDGKDAREILKSATIAGVSSVVINKLSPLDADKTFNSAKSAWNIVQRTQSGHALTEGSRIFLKNGVKYVAKKGSEKGAEIGLGAALESSTKQVPNKAPMPTYINNPMGSFKDSMGREIQY